MFAFGIIMYEVIFNVKPFSLSHAMSADVYLRREMLSRTFLAHERCADYGEEVMVSTLTWIMLRCLEPDPARRPKFDWIGVILKLALNSYANSH